MKSENCPEIRCEIAEKSRRANRDNNVDLAESKKKKFTPKLFTECGRPYCLNLPKLDFKFHDEADHYELDLHVYKYMIRASAKFFRFKLDFLVHRFRDTSLIEVDVQPNYVRVTIKGKIFQMALKEEIRVDESTSKRSQTTGRLVIVMPKLSAMNCVTMKKLIVSAPSDVGKAKGLKGVVNIRNIVVDESEIPPLI